MSSKRSISETSAGQKRLAFLESEIIRVTDEVKRLKAEKQETDRPSSPLYSPSSPLYSPSSPAYEPTERKRPVESRGKGGKGLGKASVNASIADQNYEIIREKYKKSRVKEFEGPRDVMFCLRAQMESIEKVEKLKDEINSFLWSLPSLVGEEEIILSSDQIAKLFVVEHHKQKRAFGQAIDRCLNPLAGQFKNLVKETLEFYLMEDNGGYPNHDSELFDVSVVYESSGGKRYYKIESRGDSDGEEE